MPPLLSVDVRDETLDEFLPHRIPPYSIRVTYPQKTPTASGRTLFPGRSGVRLHRLDDVRRLVGIGEARRTGRGADAFLVEQDEQRFGFDAS